MDITAEATETEVIATFNIPEENFADFEAKFAKLAKTADKLGCERPTYTVIGTSDVPLVDTLDQLQVTATTQYRRIYEVTVTGEAPRYNGWTFKAVIEFDAEATTVTVKGDDIDPTWWKLTEGYCDHCGVRRYRRKVVVVEQADVGVRKVVGTSCLRDFLGHASPDQLAAYAEFIFDIDEFGQEFEEIGHRSAPRFDTDSVLAITARVIAVEGWRPRSACQYGGRPTSSIVADILGDRDKQARAWFAENPVTPDDVAEATAARAWARNLSDDEAERSDFLLNLRALNEADTIEVGKVGFVASTISAYRRAQEKAIEQEARKVADAKAADSVHFGAVKERNIVTATITLALEIDGDYGVSTLVKGLTPEGNVVVWFASGTIDLKAGDTITGKATVKGHDERDGVKQTQVSRWNWIIVEDGETPEEAIKRDAAEAKARKAELKAIEAERQAEIAKRAAEQERNNAVRRLFFICAGLGIR